MAPNLSFKKSDKLLSTNDFSDVFKNKRFFHTKKTLKIFYHIKNQNTPRIGLIISKKIAKKAVDRNYMKRFLREWFRNNRLFLPTGDYIFFVVTRFNRNHFQEVRQELGYFTERINKKKPL